MGYIQCKNTYKFRILKYFGIPRGNLKGANDYKQSSSAKPKDKVCLCYNKFLATVL